MDYSPDKFEVIFFIVGIIISVPMLLFFQKLRRQLKSEAAQEQK